MDSAPAMIRMTGRDGLCKYCNWAWLEFRGRTAEQELGNGLAEGLHPDDHDLCMETYLKSVSARQPYLLVYRLRRRDGEYRLVEDTGVPCFKEDGTFAGFIDSARFIDSTMDV
jgi:PAS domain S-box-containing protein